MNKKIISMFLVLVMLTTMMTGCKVKDLRSEYDSNLQYANVVKLEDIPHMHNNHEEFDEAFPKYIYEPDLSKTFTKYGFNAYGIDLYDGNSTTAFKGVDKDGNHFLIMSTTSVEVIESSTQIAVGNQEVDIRDLSFTFESDNLNIYRSGQALYFLKVIADYDIGQEILDNLNVELDLTQDYEEAYKAIDFEALYNGELIANVSQLALPAYVELNADYDVMVTPTYILLKDNKYADPDIFDTKLLSGANSATDGTVMILGDGEYAMGSYLIAYDTALLLPLKAFEGTFADMFHEGGDEVDPDADTAGHGGSVDLTTFETFEYVQYYTLLEIMRLGAEEAELIEEYSPEGNFGFTINVKQDISDGDLATLAWDSIKEGLHRHAGEDITNLYVKLLMKDGYEVRYDWPVE